VEEALWTAAETLLDEVGALVACSMGRRSRKRSAAVGDRPSIADRPSNADRPLIADRPPAPWGSFPLSELLVLLGIGFMAWGLATWGSEGSLRFVGGLALASLGGLELAVREHLAGYRSHSALLAGAAAFAVVTALVIGPGPQRVWLLGLIGAAVFAAAFYGLRELFKRRSGGLGFR
jgi:hypothetical protein